MITQWGGWLKPHPSNSKTRGASRRLAMSRQGCSFFTLINILILQVRKLWQFYPYAQDGYSSRMRASMWVRRSASWVKFSADARFNMCWPCHRSQDTLGGLRQVRTVSWLRVQSHGHDSHFDFSQLTARFNLHWCDPHFIVCRLQLDMRLVRTVLILDEQMLKGFLGIGQIGQG